MWVCRNVGDSPAVGVRRMYVRMGERSLSKLEVRGARRRLPMEAWT